MRSVTLLDTAVASTNLGDEIIMDAARQQLDPLFSDAFIYRIASHEWMGGKSRGLIKRSAVSLTCGTNLLSSRMWFKPLWKLTPLDAFRRLNVTLLGAGWYQHQQKPDLYTRWLLGRVLDKNGLHSVRDEYSLTMLKAAGVSNVVNTGCPTLWALDADRCARLPREKARNVVTTINTYIKNPELDKQFLTLLTRYYENVYFWIQTETDYEYAKNLNENLQFLDPSLAAFDTLLGSDMSLDYVGNRLHAGIRAMQFGRRSVIIEVDNRALEMSRDVNLPTVRRDDLQSLESLIQSEFETKLNLPHSEIDRWKSQFHSGS